MVEIEVHWEEVPLNDLQNREASMCLGNAINIFINVIIISFFKHSTFFVERRWKQLSENEYSFIKLKFIFKVNTFRFGYIFINNLFLNDD